MFLVLINHITIIFIFNLYFGLEVTFEIIWVTSVYLSLLKLMQIREAVTNKKVKLGEKSKQGGGLTRYEPLNRFLKMLRML